MTTPRLSPAHPSPKAQMGRLAAQGLSLIEMLVTLALLMVLLGGAVPMASDLRSGMLLHATAALLETDLQFARASAISSGVTVRLAVLPTAGGGSCYLVYAGPANACTCDALGPARCEPGATLLRLEEQPAQRGVSIAPLSRAILFDAHKGTVTPTATLQVQAADGRAIHQVVNIMGRVRSCAPAGQVNGLPKCS